MSTGYRLTRRGERVLNAVAALSVVGMIAMMAGLLAAWFNLI